MRVTKPFSLIFLLGVLMVASCGIKPGDVDAPPGVNANAYPRTYPDISTDPRPEAPRP